jgi:hypothetical protein
MYSFAQRTDTRVFDEPLYAHYLANSPARDYHPGAGQVLAEMENDGEKVVRDLILADHPAPVVFFKHMTHHLHGLKRDFLDHTVNVLLTRDPRDMLPSYAAVVKTPTLNDVGYATHLELFHDLKGRGQSPPVLDSKQVLLNPAGVLSELCRRIGIPFQPGMLKWEAGGRPEDGSWARYWYHAVHRSTGFEKYRPKTDPFPEKLIPLLEECLPYYEQLQALSDCSGGQ